VTNQTRIVLLLAVALGGAGCAQQQAATTTISTLPSTVAAPQPAKLTGRVTGRMHLNPYDSLNSDTQAMRKLAWSHIACAWRGGHVWVSGRFRNPLGASIAVTVGPTYRLRNAGQHGDSSSSGFTVHVAAHGSRAWRGDAGAPSGVAGTPRITACIPEIAGVSLG
jgi:hypothetical protein